MDIQDILERIKYKYPKKKNLKVEIYLEGDGYLTDWGDDDKILIDFTSLCDLWNKLTDEPCGE